MLPAVTEGLFHHSEDRVRKGADRLKARLKTKQQGRLDSFFTVKPKDPKDIKKRKVSARYLYQQEVL